MRISGCPALYLYICASRLCRQIFLSSLRFVIQALRDAVFACCCAVQIACCETPAFTPGVSCSMTVCRPMSARLECKHSRAAAAVRIFTQKRRRLLLRFSAKQLPPVGQLVPLPSPVHFVYNAVCCFCIADSTGRCARTCCRACDNPVTPEPFSLFFVVL